MFDCCYRTVKATSRILRCWLHTTTRDRYWKKPFQLAKPDTYRRYRALWKQFLCFVFRVWAADVGLRQQPYSQLRFSERQEVLLAEVWASLGSEEVYKAGPDVGSDAGSDAGSDTGSDIGSDARSDAGSDIGSDIESDIESEFGSDTTSEPGSEAGSAFQSGPDSGWESGLESDLDSQSDVDSQADSESSPGIRSGSRSGSRPDLDSNPVFDLAVEAGMHPEVEQLFQLSSLFWVDSDSTASGNPAELPLVYFLGVLGIQQKTLSFRTAYHYTPFLAGLVWIGRLLLLEYALPLSPYLSLSWPAASACPNQLKRLQYIRRKYMCQGSVYPIGHLLDTLRFGRDQAFKLGPRTNISWSLDRQTLQLKTQFIKLGNFRIMVWLGIQDAQQALQALMLNWKPTPYSAQIN